MKNTPLRWILIGVGIVVLLILGFWLARRLSAPRPVAEATASPDITRPTASPGLRTRLRWLLPISQPSSSLRSLPLPTSLTHLGPKRLKYQAGDQYLIVEFLDDDLVHFEMSAFGRVGTSVSRFTPAR